VADPDLGGGQVAVLRLHAASVGHATNAAYSCVRGMYVRQGTKQVRAPRKPRASENSVNANFHEKALFVKVDVATPSCASATALCPSLCFHPHF
jgi:hypothetical protein